MSSLFDDIFGGSASGILMEYAGDSRLVDYEIDGNKIIEGIQAIISSAYALEVEGSDGVFRKETRCNITVLRDEDSPWGGVNDPQIKGSFVFDGHMWSIEDLSAVAIEGRSETFVTMALIRKRAVGKEYPGFRVYT